ncbi:hypothetical protein [Desulfobaculum bizertense]|uniref:SGNH hydrolase-like domain-containing protein, acetyltransferase AlgX n=1 Tax=Desulfobaculum bizertense DSM 18034 TaxID=1121442 RepID=A0A1T4VQK2_9BACT|nr:hypothetical protein [Desulfobaculum bizertense]SKA67199.1 hypothetical protein SAMN02745702_00781 [Desulfobaculum bizertense DSM 18034]
MFKKHVLFIMAGIIFPFMALLAVNATVDPLQIYHPQYFAKERFWNNQRYQNAAKLKHFIHKADAVLIGNSIADCSSPRNISKQMNWNQTLKLTVDGGQISEQSFMLTEALKHPNIKHVFWGLRTQIFNKERADVWHRSQVIPFYLYDRSPFNDLPYLASLTTLKNSWATITAPKQEKHGWKTTSLNWLNYWMTPSKGSRCARFPFDKHSAKLRRLAQKSHTFLSTTTFPKGRKIRLRKLPSIEKHIVHTVERHPDVDFTIFIAPESYLRLQSRGHAFPDYLRAQKTLVMALKDLPNVHIYGFEDNSRLCGNLYNFCDQTHYHSGVNQWMLDKIAQGKGQLTPGNIDRYLQRVFANTIAYTPHWDASRVIPMLKKKERRAFYREVRKREAHAPKS